MLVSVSVSVSVGVNLDVLESAGLHFKFNGPGPAALIYPSKLAPVKCQGDGLFLFQVWVCRVLE